MAYDKLNLSEGDLISSAHIHHIEEGISAFEAQFNDVKNKLADILKDKTVMANGEESFSDLFKKVSTLRAPEVPAYEQEDVIDTRETVRSGQIQIVCTDTSIGFSCRGTAGFVIDWGDGTSSTVTATTATNCGHTYAAGVGEPYIDGANQVVITIAPLDGGRLNTWTLGDTNKASMLSFVAKDVYFQSASAMFNGCTSVRYIDLIGGSFGASDLNTSFYNFAYNCRNLERLTGAVAWNNVTNMQASFQNCFKLKDLNLGDSWNSVNVTSFLATFNSCRALTSIPYFRTDSVTTMGSCFADMPILEAINGDVWNLENCVAADNMFYMCKSLVTIPELRNTSGIQSCENMFRECTSLVKLHDNQHTLDLSGCAVLDRVFMKCTALEEIPNLKLDAATSAIFMFANCFNLSIVPETITFPKVTGANSGSDIFDENATSGVYGLGGLFMNCTSLVSAPTIVAPKCLNICCLYKGCENLINVPENFSFPSVLRAAGVFYGCIRLQTAPRFLNLPAVQRMPDLFSGCTSLVVAPSPQENDTFEFDDLLVCARMFNGCTALQMSPVEMIFPSLTSAAALFSGCSALQKAPKLVELESATDINSMFNGCSSLQYPPEKIVANKATNASNLFAFCSSLLVCPEIEASSATNINMMFYHCGNLTSTVAYDFPSATVHQYMFEACANLKIFDSLHVKSSTSSVAPDTLKLEIITMPTCDGYFTTGLFGNQTLLRTVNGEIDCYPTSNAVHALVASPYIEGVLTLKAPRADITISNRKGITGIRITDPQTTMNNITVTNCSLSAAAINQLFTDLPTIPSSRVISVAGNPGATTCDTSIATAKGWTVVTT